MQSPAPVLPAPPLPGWLQRMLPASAERRLVDVDGVRVHVTEVGPARARPVLMLHGNPTWGFLYRKVAQALLARAAGGGPALRLIMPDLVGLGFSDKPRGAEAHTLENHARWIGGAIDALGLDDLLFVGQDWGGPVGLLALAERRERLRGIVLCNTVIGPPRPGFKATAFHRFARAPLIASLAFRGLQFPQSMLWIAQHDRASVRGEVGRAYRYPLRRFADRVAPLALARMVPDTMEHPSIQPLRRCQDLCESFEGPIAGVWGVRDWVLGRVVNHIERLLPRATIERVEAGHFLQEEVPEPIAAAIDQMARQL